MPAEDPGPLSGGHRGGGDTAAGLAPTGGAAAAGAGAASLPRVDLPAPAARPSSSEAQLFWLQTLAVVQKNSLIQVPHAGRGGCIRCRMARKCRARTAWWRPSRSLAVCCA